MRGDVDTVLEVMIGLDAFMSYARLDADRVWELVDAAKTRGRNLWMDSDGIPPGAPWRQELGTAIQAADSFVCALSPNWLRSTECRLEHQRAVELGKRIIPVLLADMPGAPEEISALQWIDAREALADEVADELLRTIDVDHERVKEHTNWLARAVRWEARGENRSALLRGAELEAAEAWLNRTGPPPSPTPLQERYIGQSRIDEHLRGRRRVAAVLLTTVVLLAAAAVAVVQGTAKNSSRRQSRSRALAAAALSQLGVDPQRSLLLAREAWKQAATSQARNALEDSVVASRVRLSVGGFSTVASGVSWSQSDADLIAAGRGSVGAWSAATGAARRRFNLNAGAVSAFAADAAGDAGVTATTSGQAVLWRVARSSGTLIRAAVLSPSGATTAAISADGRTVAVALGDGQVRAWQLPSLKRHEFRVTAVGRPSCLGISPLGRTLVIGGSDGTAVTATPAGTIHPLARYGAPVADCGFDEGARTVVTVAQDGNGAVQRVRDGHALVKLGHVIGDALAASGRYVATTQYGGGARLYDLATGRWRTLLAGGANMFSIAFSRDGTWVAAGGVDGVAHVWPVTGSGSPVDLRGSAANIIGLSFSHDGRYLATGDSSGRICSWELPPAALSLTVLRAGDSAVAPVQSIALTPDGRTAVTTSAIVWTSSTTTGQTACPSGSTCALAVPQVEALAVSVAGAEGFPVDAVYGPGARLAITSEAGPVGIWNAADATEVVRAPTGAERVDDVAFSPDGRLLAVSGRGGGAKLVRAATGRLIAVLSRDTKDVYAVAFVDRGRAVVTAGTDGKLWLWDDRGHFRRTLADLPHPVLALAPAPGGQQIAAASGDSLTVLRVSDGATVQSLSAHAGDITSVAYGGQPNFLVSGSADGDVTVWDTRSGQVAQDFSLPSGVNSVAVDLSDRIIGAATTRSGAYVLRCEVCLPAPQLLQLAAIRSIRALSSREQAEFGVP